MKPAKNNGFFLLKYRHLDDTVLMNPGLMTKGISPDNGLIRLNQKTGQITDQPTGIMNLRGINPGSQVKKVLAGLDSHHDFLK